MHEGNKLDKCYNGTYYESYSLIKGSNGYVEEYYTGEYCYNSLLVIPGTSLLPHGL